MLRRPRATPRRRRQEVTIENTLLRKKLAVLDSVSCVGRGFPRTSSWRSSAPSPKRKEVSLTLVRACDVLKPRLATTPSSTTREGIIAPGGWTDAIPRSSRSRASLRTHVPQADTALDHHGPTSRDHGTRRRMLAGWLFGSNNPYTLIHRQQSSGSIRPEPSRPLVVRLQIGSSKDAEMK
jgi:hypothetical protein